MRRELVPLFLLYMKKSRFKATELDDLPYWYPFSHHGLSVTYPTSGDAVSLSLESYEYTVRGTTTEITTLSDLCYHIVWDYVGW